jgi:hypothetical protein
MSVLPDPHIECLTLKKIISRKGEEMTPGRNDEDRTNWRFAVEMKGKMQ